MKPLYSPASLPANVVVEVGPCVRSAAAWSLPSSPCLACTPLPFAFWATQRLHIRRDSQQTPRVPVGGRRSDRHAPRQGSLRGRRRTALAGSASPGGVVTVVSYHTIRGDFHEPSWLFLFSLIRSTAVGSSSMEKRKSSKKMKNSASQLKTQSAFIAGVLSEPKQPQSIEMTEGWESRPAVAMYRETSDDNHSAFWGRDTSWKWCRAPRPAVARNVNEYIEPVDEIPVVRPSAPLHDTPPSVSPGVTSLNPGASLQTQARVPNPSGRWHGDLWVSEFRLLHSTRRALSTLLSRCSVRPLMLSDHAYRCCRRRR